MERIEEYKRAAAAAALDGEVRSGMRVGLGSGSTIAHFLDLLGERLDQGRLQRVVGVPTSEKSAERARALGIPLAPLHVTAPLDVTVDGADEVDPALDLIKGLGGALVREKIVAQQSRRLVIIADERKQVARLGTRAPLPVEVLPYAWRVHLPFLESLGCRATRRASPGGDPVVTDNGNFILDCAFDPVRGIEDPAALAARLDGRAGIVGHGLFLNLTRIVFLAGGSGVTPISLDRA